MIGKRTSLSLLLAFSFYEKGICVAHDGVRRESAKTRSLRSIAWRHESFPNPGSCGSSSSRICDPDSILSAGDMEFLDSAIDEFEQSQLITCTDKSTRTSSEVSDTDLLFEPQLAVAIVNRMDLTSFAAVVDEEEEAARTFARHVHDTWGVGEVTECGGTGILIFLSIHDRAMYISVGEALQSVLTDHRLDTVISNMKPFLRNEKIGDALMHALDDIAVFIKSGTPSFKERFWDSIEDIGAYIMMAIMAIFFVFKLRRHEQRQREYAQVSSQLSQLDRDRAEALQGRYQCTSCPICFEPFKVQPAEAEEETDDTTDNSTSNDAPKFGSDGLPLKLLRCGHVFDETCWSEWVSSGAGNVRKCPICQQDVGGESETPNRDDAVRLRNNGQAGAEEVRLQRFNRERNFRLMRLGMRFPHYVGQQQIQRWTDSNYNGSLARDPRFVQSNPTNRVRHSGGRLGRSGGGGHSFGGGVGSSGRGGRW